MKDICNLLIDIEPYCIDGYLTDKNYNQEHTDSEPIYIPHEKILTSEYYKQII